MYAPTVTSPLLPIGRFAQIVIRRKSFAANATVGQTAQQNRSLQMNKKGQSPRQMTGFAMRGGIDEPTDVPDAIYWKRGAERAREEFYDLAKNDEKTNRIMFKYWKEENTWWFIFDRTQHALDLFRKLRTWTAEEILKREG